MREEPGTESKSDSWEDHAINSLFPSLCPISPPPPFRLFADSCYCHSLLHPKCHTLLFFCLFISLSTPPRSLNANLASSFCPRDLKQIPEALFSVLYLQASSKSSRPQSSFLIFVSLAKSSTTCKHVHVGIRMSVHANTHIHINTHTYTLHTHVIKADNETCL